MNHETEPHPQGMTCLIIFFLNIMLTHFFHIFMLYSSNVNFIQMFCNSLISSYIVLMSIQTLMSKYISHMTNMTASVKLQASRWSHTDITMSFMYLLRDLKSLNVNGKTLYFKRSPSALLNHCVVSLHADCIMPAGVTLKGFPGSWVE